MVDLRTGASGGRARLGWWLFVTGLAAAVTFVAWQFVGMLVVGVFGYYATRPIYEQIGTYVDSDEIAAWTTISVVLLPVVLVLVYAGVQLFSAVQRVLGGPDQSPLFAKYLGMLSAEQRRTVLEVVRNPQQFVTNPGQTTQRLLDVGLQAASALFGALVLIALAVTLTYFLLKNDDDLASGLRDLFGGRDTAAYAYASAVDRDLESVFFGNFVFVAVMAVVAAVAYWGTNLLAPAGVRVPMVLPLALLTGAASLIPLVVSKVIYLPVVGYLALQAYGGDGSLAFVAGVLVAYFLVLDVLPQTFLQPYITGRNLDVVLMMFAYVLGPILFGWYGFFLLPILLVLVVEAIRIVLPELLHGEQLTPTVSAAASVGADPRRPGQVPSAGGDAEGDDGEAGDVEGDDGEADGGEVDGETAGESAGPGGH